MANQDRIESNYDDLKRKISAQVTKGKLVLDTISTLGWKETIHPMIDNMIADVLGRRRKDGSWDSGAISLNKEHGLEYYLGYRQFGMDLINRILALVKMIDIGEDRVKKIDAMLKSGDRTRMENSFYYPEDTLHISKK